MRDPFYLKIVGGLQGDLDPDVFEACAADLLLDEWPTLVPIQGGSDSGMDGAVADGIGEPFPLVTTTSKDVIGNLTRNLSKYKEEGGKRRKAILATSTLLTARREQNLKDRASELGFTLVQVYSQPALASRLYRSPRWCRELLNLSGDPSPRSVVPKSDRPLREQPLLGRDEDLEWLENVEQDSLLVGQPGVGKTFLLHRFAVEGCGLFAVSEDRGELAGAVREQQPKVIIVDDAQVHLDLVRNLRQLRTDTGASFSILATCWPNDEKNVSGALNLLSSDIRTLEPLTRDVMVEVVKGVGIYRPNELIREILNQAEGRPGLAVTLARLCLQGDIQRVFTGDALSRSFLNFFNRAVGERAGQILAAFSVGGDAGLPINLVAATLGLSPVEVQTAVVKLAAGGVVLDRGKQLLSVRPAALRHTLVRDVFFNGSFSLGG